MPKAKSQYGFKIVRTEEGKDISKMVPFDSTVYPEQEQAVKWLNKYIGNETIKVGTHIIVPASRDDNLNCDVYDGEDSKPKYFKIVLTARRATKAAVMGMIFENKKKATEFFQKQNAKFKSIHRIAPATKQEMEDYRLEEGADLVKGKKNEVLEKARRRNFKEAKPKFRKLSPAEQDALNDADENGKEELDRESYETWQAFVEDKKAGNSYTKLGEFFQQHFNSEDTLALLVNRCGLLEVVYISVTEKGFIKWRPVYPASAVRLPALFYDYWFDSLTIFNEILMWRVFPLRNGIKRI